MARTKSFKETEVLDKIQRLFLANGFNGTSVDDLVHASGLSRSSLYDTFGDKESLFISALSKYRAENTQTMIEKIQKSHDIKQTIREIFEYIEEDSKQQKKLGCMMVNTAVELAPHDKKVGALVDENMTSIHRVLSQALKKAQATGEISKQFSSEAIATLILTTINGLRVAEKWGSNEKVYKQVMQLVLSKL